MDTLHTALLQTHHSAHCPVDYTVHHPHTLLLSYKISFRQLLQWHNVLSSVFLHHRLPARCCWNTSSELAHSLLTSSRHWNAQGFDVSSTDSVGCCWRWNLYDMACLISRSGSHLAYYQMLALTLSPPSLIDYGHRRFSCLMTHLLFRKSCHPPIENSKASFPSQWR